MPGKKGADAAAATRRRATPRSPPARPARPHAPPLDLGPAVRSGSGGAGRASVTSPVPRSHRSGGHQPPLSSARSRSSSVSVAATAQSSAEAHPDAASRDAEARSPDASPPEEVRPDASPETADEARSLLQEELRGWSAAVDPKDTVARAVRECQRFLGTFEYSVAGPSFKPKKSRPLSDLLGVGTEILRARDKVAIQCIEGAFVGMYLTQGLPQLTRFGISFESMLPCGYRYYHQLLGVVLPRDRPLFGAFGHSRDFGLASKPMVFPSLQALLRNYRVHYRRAGHEPISCKLGRPIYNGPWRVTSDPLFREAPVWIQEAFSFGCAGWPEQVDRYENKLMNPGERWGEPKAQPYRREKTEEPSGAMSPKHRPRSVPHRPPAASDDRTTPTANSIGRRSVDVTAPDEFARRIRLGQFRPCCPGRLRLDEAAAHAVTISLFARCRASQLAACSVEAAPDDPPQTPASAASLGDLDVDLLAPEQSPATTPRSPATERQAAGSPFPELPEAEPPPAQQQPPEPPQPALEPPAQPPQPAQAAPALAPEAPEPPAPPPPAAMPPAAEPFAAPGAHDAAVAELDAVLAELAAAPAPSRVPPPAATADVQAPPASADAAQRLPLAAAAPAPLPPPLASAALLLPEPRLVGPTSPPRPAAEPPSSLLMTPPLPASPPFTAPPAFTAAPNPLVAAFLDPPARDRERSGSAALLSPPPARRRMDPSPSEGVHVTCEILAGIAQVPRVVVVSASDEASPARYPFGGDFSNALPHTGVISRLRSVCGRLARSVGCLRTRAALQLHFSAGADVSELRVFSTAQTAQLRAKTGQLLTHAQARSAGEATLVLRLHGAYHRLGSAVHSPLLLELSAPSDGAVDVRGVQVVAEPAGCAHPGALVLPPADGAADNTSALSDSLPFADGIDDAMLDGTRRRSAFRCFGLW